MGRKKAKPEYDAEKIQQELIAIAVELYNTSNNTESDNEENADAGSNGKIRYANSLRMIAAELNISVSKVVKLLITGGAYKTKLSDSINRLYNEGKSLKDIERYLNISRSTVQSYLPYKKGIYKAKESSLNADRIKRYRCRCGAIKHLSEVMSIDALWDCICLFADYNFYTVKGLKFKYTVKGKEIFIDRKEAPKSITISTVEMAFKKSLEMINADGFVSGPKKLGTYGASYLYSMFIRFGIIKQEPNSLLWPTAMD